MRALVASLLAVRRTEGDAQGLNGRGIGVQMASLLVLNASLIEQSPQHRALPGGSDAIVDTTIVRATELDALGLFARGISAEAGSTLTLRASLIEQNHDAGVAAIGSAATIEACVVRDTSVRGAQTSIGGSVLSCQAFDINSETYADRRATLDDLGGNVCGCPVADRDCEGVSANLEPPPVHE